MMTGTDDFAYSYDNLRSEKMHNSEYFTELSDTTDGNFLYFIKDGYSHNDIASNEYTYNGLCWFWK